MTVSQRFKTPYADVLPPLTSGEQAALRASIAAEGVRVPVLVTEDEAVLDGHHRLVYCPDAPFQVVPGSGSWSEARRVAFVLASNEHRRNLSPDQRKEVRRRQREVAAGLKAEGYTLAEVSQFVGVPVQTVSDWLSEEPNSGAGIGFLPDCRVKLSSAARKSLVERIEAGEPVRQVAADLGITPQHCRRVHKQERNPLGDPAAAEDAPVTCSADDLDELVRLGRKYGTIYVDPPWEYDNRATRASADDHYGTMTLAEIAALPVAELAAGYCHLHLWTTNAFLFECPKLFHAWGFTYQGFYTWCKPQMGMGNCWRVSSEILLLAIKGEPRRFRVRDLKDWGEFDRRDHSEKPPEVRNLIERASPGPYLELFGRRLVVGWTVWGNQVQKDVRSWGGAA